MLSLLNTSVLGEPSILSSTLLLVIKYMWVFPKPSNSLTLLECPTFQFHSDTIYLELAKTPQVKVSVTQDCPTSFRCQAQVQAVIYISDRLAINQSSHNFLLRLD